MRPLHILQALLVVTIWGANLAVIKVAVQEIPPSVLLSIRFLIASAILLPFTKVKRSEIFVLLRLSIILNVLHYGFVFASLQFLDASSAAILAQSGTPFAVICGMLFFGERPGIKTYGGIVLAIAGIVVIFGSPQVTSTGLVCMLLGSAFWALAQVELKKLGQIHLPTFLAYTMLFCTPFHVVWMMSTVPDWMGLALNADWTIVSAVLVYQIGFGCWAMMTWQRLTTHNPLALLTPINLLGPVIGVLVGVLLLDERLTVHLLLGGGMTIAGVAMVVLKGSKHKIASQSQGPAQ